jgi:hypothetical protein
MFLLCLKLDFEQKEKMKNQWEALMSFCQIMRDLTLCGRIGFQDIPDFVMNATVIRKHIPKNWSMNVIYV